MATANSQDQPVRPEYFRQPDHPTLDLLRQRWERLNIRNEHWMCCIVGQEGVGKSYTALKLANMMDPTFDADRVIFDLTEFMQILKDEQYSAGETYVIDEAGVSLGNRTWQDEEQVKLNQALQLIRSHNLGLVFTLPRLSELDSQTEGRLQDVIELRKKVDGEYAEGGWWELDVDRLNMSTGRDGVFKQKPHWREQEIQTVRFSPPEGEFVERYEEQKQEFQEQTYSEIIEEEEDEEQTTEQLILDIVRRATNEGIGDLLGWHGGHNKPVIKTHKIRQKYDISRDDAQAVKEALRDAPGVSIEEAWEDRGAQNAPTS